MVHLLRHCHRGVFSYPYATGHPAYPEASAGRRTVEQRPHPGDRRRPMGHPELGITPATVRKHLEAVFARLGVTHRAAAVARVRSLLDGAPTG